MKFERLILSLAALMLCVMLAAMLSIESIIAVVIAVLLHELGHLAAIYMLGLHVTGMGLELSGMRIDYTGISSAYKDVLVALAGPMAGVLYCLTACTFADRTGSPVIALSAELSLLYSFFNLLPIMPLDGGRVLFCVAEEALNEPLAKALSRLSSLVLSAAFLMLGLFLLLRGEGAAIFAAGMWLLLFQS